MKRKVIVLNEKDYKSREEVFLKIKKELSFPDYFGNNLDALCDSLSEVFYPVTIILIVNRNSEWEDLQNALKIASQENKHINIVKMKRLLK